MTVPITSPLPGLISNLVVWGTDVNHQLRDRPKLGKFLSIATGGGTQALALGDDGLPVLWGGFNPNSPDGKPDKPIVPDLLLVKGDSYTHVSIGITAAAAIRQENQWIETWGMFLTVGGTVSAVVPESYFLMGMKFTAVAMAGDHGVAINTDGHLLQWGGNEGSQPKPNPNTTFVGVWARNDYSVALDHDGHLYGWGGNLFSPPTAWYPHGGPLVGKGWYFQSAGGYWLNPDQFRTVAVGSKAPSGMAHVLALRFDQTVAGWGDDTFGQISGKPTTPLIEIAAGQGFSVGLDSTRQLSHWGKPLASPATEAAALAPPSDPVTSLSAGAAHVSALRVRRS